MSTVAPDGRNQQELRLALAMRGGASMAVWIGGAVAEINHLRSALTPAEEAEETPDPKAAAPFGRTMRKPRKDDAGSAGAGKKDAGQTQTDTPAADAGAGKADQSDAPDAAKAHPESSGGKPGGSDGATTPSALDADTTSISVRRSPRLPAGAPGGDGSRAIDLGDPTETELSDAPDAADDGGNARGAEETEPDNAASANVERTNAESENGAAQSDTAPKAPKGTARNGSGDPEQTPDAAGTTATAPRATLDEHPWAALARLAGYDSVAVDVLAGASAGGLNATLLSTSLVYGLPFDRMRETWVRLADLEAMSRPVPMLWHRKPMSLLEGDEYFRAELAEILNDTKNPDPTRADRADLLLTATLLDPVVERRFDGGSTPIMEERRRASFRFRHRGRPGDPLSDFSAGVARRRTALELAQAARATSSYPFAFEPAQVHARPDEPPLGEPNMFGLFSEVTTPPERRPFRVIDGGVLDNIPVEAAIQSIASSVADRPTERWLLYLNPEPELPDTGRASRLALPVASTAMRARLTQESLLADIKALEEHNSSVERTALRRKALFAQIAAVEPEERAVELRRVVDAVLGDHAVVRVELDALAIVALLTHPQGREDGRLLPPVAGDPLAGWSGAAVTELPEALSRRLVRSADPDAVFGDVRGFLSAVEECLGWAQDLERRSSVAASREIGRCKAALYRLRVFGEVLEGHADRYWLHGAQLEPIVDPAELNAWVDRVEHRRRRLQHSLPSPISPMLGAVLAEVEQGEDLVGESFQTPLADLAKELLSIVDSSGADAVTEDAPGHVDAVAEAFGVLDRVAARLAFTAPRRTEFEEPAQIGYGVLESVEADDRSEVLGQLVTLTAPLDVGRAPGSRIRFMRVQSDATTPLPFEALRSNGELRVEDKIRGGDLGNFGAFLSARWRANDWMWGRMDAATSLVEMLCDPARLRYHNETVGAAGVFDVVATIAATPSAGELRDPGESVMAKWRAFLAERWDERAEDVRSELERLFALPDGDHPLAATRAALTERLQWTIAATELPFVQGVSSGAEPDLVEAEPEPLPAPRRVSAEVEEYAVGTQRVADLGERRVAGMATRFALLAHRAVRPAANGIWSWLARCGIALLKPFVVLVAMAVAAPVRVATVGLLGSLVAVSAAPLAVLSDAETGLDDAGLSGVVPVSFAGGDVGVVGVVGWILAVLFAIWLGAVGSGRAKAGGFERWAFAVVLAVVPLALGYLAWAGGFRLRPWGLVIAAVGLTWLATFAYRTAGRFVAAVVTAVAFGGMTWAFADGVLVSWANASWLGWALLVTAYAHAALLSTVDVLPPRPRADPLRAMS